MDIIENPKTVDANGIIDCINGAFERIGMADFRTKLYAINLDGASVNMGKKKGVASLLKNDLPWLLAVHCFNHRLELGIKDAMEGTRFSDIDEMLNKIYFYYQTSSKRLRGLRELADELENCVPKPTKATGTRWIAQLILQNDGTFGGTLLY